MTGPEALLLQLSSFTPTRPRASREDWAALTHLAPPHGLAPLIAYNVEYRLAGAGAPQEVRDVLLSHYQGALADNVFKFVNLKRLLTLSPERPVLLLDSAAFADSLYPHVAFRPTTELRMAVRAADLEALQRDFASHGFPIVPNDDPYGAAAISSDDRTRLVLHTRLFPQARAAQESQLWERALPSRAFGVSAHRPALEDALLSAVLLQARQGFDAPLLTLVDVRELVRGSPDLGGPYSHAPDVEVVRERAAAFKLERALWIAMELVATLFPDVAEKARALEPKLRPASQALLRKLVIAHTLDLQRTSAARGSERMRRLLSGG